MRSTRRRIQPPDALAAFAQQNWPWMQRLFVFNHHASTDAWCGGYCYPGNSSPPWFSILNRDRTPRLAYSALKNMPKS